MTAGTGRTARARPREAIVEAVLELLKEGGYEAVHLREVARRARVSLATIYKFFPTREELIVTAVERWMAANGCADLVPAVPGETLYEGLMRVFRHVFEPWERDPRMLEVYQRAQASPGGQRLRRQTTWTIEPVGRAMLQGLDPHYAADVALVLTHLGHAVVGAFAAGELDVTEILPVLERAVYRLTADNATAAKGLSGTGPGAQTGGSKPRA
ncbi:TetR/AcrR family transcriptional regulator [Actinomadura vinacea]|uniref:TetR/AcrR family transcriptional regulator n=1 Tax=Actinomadura vinacea TaxID=115336 RepID=A0ABP5WRY6_9ACTN